MANWTRKLDLKDVWHTDGEDPSHPSPAELAKLAGIIAARLKAIRPYDDADVNEERDMLVERFEELSRSQPDADDFDDVMSDLYDWGDLPLDNKWAGKKVCWISTIL